MDMTKNANDVLAPRRTKRRRGLLAILLGSSVLTLGAGTMSLATFTDASTNGGSWSSGTIVLGASPSTAFTASGIMPGASGSADISVANNGTGDLRYSLTSASTNADGKGLAGRISLVISAGSCSAPGATLYSGVLGSAAMGSNAQGAQAGDRNVLAGATDVLCFVWAFPLSSGNAYQGAATSATFTFDAEQTANNP